MDYQHPYDKLSLSGVGILLGLVLVAAHLLMLLQRQRVQMLLVKFQRDPMAGQILLAIGLGWFWLLLAPPNLGILSKLAMDFGEFNSAKPMLRILVPLSLVLVAMSVRDFLAVRALGLIGLMAAAPILQAAFLKEPATRLLLPLYAYFVLTASMFMVGKPYLFRNALDWARANNGRWRMLCMAGVAYGVAILTCAMLFWRGA